MYHGAQLWRCRYRCVNLNSSHVKHFPNEAAYNESYNFVVDTSEIGVAQFAMRIQILLVDYLCASYGDVTTDWCETYWTGDRG